MIRNF